MAPANKDHHNKTHRGVTKASKMCSYYLAGRCRYGSECRKNHSTQTTQPPQQPPCTVKTNSAIVDTAPVAPAVSTAPKPLTLVLDSTLQANTALFTAARAVETLCATPALLSDLFRPLAAQFCQLEGKALDSVCLTSLALYHALCPPNCPRSFPIKPMTLPCDGYLAYSRDDETIRINTKLLSAHSDPTGAKPESMTVFLFVALVHWLCHASTRALNVLAGNWHSTCNDSRLDWQAPHEIGYLNEVYHHDSGVAMQLILFGGLVELRDGSVHARKTPDHVDKLTPGHVVKPIAHQLDLLAYGEVSALNAAYGGSLHTLFASMRYNTLPKSRKSVTKHIVKANVPNGMQAGADVSNATTVKATAKVTGNVLCVSVQYSPENMPEPNPMFLRRHAERRYRSIWDPVKE